jgi:hypothetical protein
MRPVERTIPRVAAALLCAALLWPAQPARAQFTQQFELFGTDATGAARQGFTVALSGDGNTALVGGPTNNSNAGAAWVFTRSGRVWTEQAKLVGTGASADAKQGFSVALSGDGNTALVGGPTDNSEAGAAWVFTRSGGVWSQQAKLVGTGASANAEQGLSVALSGDGNTAIVGGSQDSSNAGATWVFARSGGIWAQQAKLIGTDAIGNAEQGFSVALSGDGNTAIVGGPADNSNTGAAWVFIRSGGLWSEQAKLLGFIATVGAQEGHSVALSGDGNTALVGGPMDTSSNNGGAAWVFTRFGGLWSQQAKLIGGNAMGNAEQGWSVALSIDGNTAIVGGPFDSNLVGAAWVFIRSGTWGPTGGIKLSGTGNAGASFQGNSVALSSCSTALVGGHLTTIVLPERRGSS